MPRYNDKGTKFEYVTTGTGASLLAFRSTSTNTEGFGIGLDSSTDALFKCAEVDTMKLLGASVGSGWTGMYLITNQGGTLGVKLVSLGAHDSAGSGYRVLRVTQTP